MTTNMLANWFAQNLVDLLLVFVLTYLIGFSLVDYLLFIQNDQKIKTSKMKCCENTWICINFVKSFKDLLIPVFLIQ